MTLAARVKLLQELNLTSVVEVVRGDSSDERDVRSLAASGSVAQRVCWQVAHDRMKRAVLVAQ